jgi:hypothetical protein
MTDITDSSGYALTDYVVGLPATGKVTPGTIDTLGPITVTPAVGTIVIGVAVDSNENLHIVTLNPL